MQRKSNLSARDQTYLSSALSGTQGSQSSRTPSDATSSSQSQARSVSVSFRDSHGSEIEDVIYLSEEQGSRSSESVEKDCHAEKTTKRKSPSVSLAARLMDLTTRAVSILEDALTPTPPTRYHRY
mmetsp:Transcript_31224/g.71287  ORF Transcript_31224/g.71287 Transcript_31224/m.71287 type:complete len:125 (-) Transcript_31224:216-590(-)